VGEGGQMSDILRDAIVEALKDVHIETGRIDQFEETVDGLVCAILRIDIDGKFKQLQEREDFIQRSTEAVFEYGKREGRKEFLEKLRDLLELT
jgi:hypothetical protein